MRYRSILVVLSVGFSASLVIPYYLQQVVFHSKTGPVAQVNDESKAESLATTAVLSYDSTAKATARNVEQAKQYNSLKKDRYDMLSTYNAETTLTTTSDRSVLSKNTTAKSNNIETIDPKRGVKGTLMCKGVKTDSEVIYWRDVPGDATYESPITPHHGEHHDTYITFRYDMGGWNNIRMGIEIMVVTAHAMGRTLVVPPENNLYLLGRPVKDPKTGKSVHRKLGFADFFSMDTLRQHKGLHVLSMEEFLAKEGVTGQLKGGKLPPKNNTRVIGKDLWEYLSAVADKEPEWDRAVFALPDSIEQLTSATSNHENAIEEFISTLDAQKQHRLKKFRQGGRKVVFYTPELQQAKLLHFAADGKRRLLQHHYAFNFFADPKMQSFYKRLIRDYMRYQDEIQCAGHELVSLLRRDAREAALQMREQNRGEGFDSNNQSSHFPYYALHIRRGDFQYKDVKISAVEILNNLGTNELIPRGSIVYISTDDPQGVCKGCTFSQSFTPCPIGVEAQGIPGCIEDPSWKAFTDIAGWKVRFLGDYLEQGALKGLNVNYYGMVESIVCSRADIFVGTWYSTFTGYIHRMRGYHGLGEETYYHTTGRKESARSKESIGHGFSREWRYGWTDDQGALI